MSADRLVQQYVSGLNQEISSCLTEMESRNFPDLEAFVRVQERLRTFRKSLEILQSVPEDDLDP